MSTKPYLIIVAGPTASGKGSAPGKIQNMLHLSTNHQTVLIDNLVEANPHYRAGVQEFIHTKRQERLSNDDIDNIFSNPTPEIIETFNNLYFESRKNTDCHTGELIESNKEHPSSDTCDAVNDAILDNAFKNYENIVFETTGEWWPGWLFHKYDSYIKNGNYDIIMAYSIVSLCELLFRNKSRAVQSIRNFLKNDKGTPPRLPDIRLDKYTAGLSKIIETFKLHNLKCSNETDDICVRFVIFDNRSHDGDVLYDSKKDAVDKGNNVIDLYHVNSGDNCRPIGGNGKRRSYKRKKSKRTKRKRNSIKRKRKSINRKRKSINRKIK